MIDKQCAEWIVDKKQVTERRCSAAGRYEYCGSHWCRRHLLAHRGRLLKLVSEVDKVLAAKPVG